MTALRLPRHSQVLRARSDVSAVPPEIVEFAYYAVLVYSMLAPGLGIQIPLFSGGMLLVLAAVCVIQVGTQATAVYAPIRLPLACAMCFLVVDVTVHGGSIMSDLSRAFITWILAVIIIQSLSLRRGFLHRCALVLFVIGLTTVPFLIAKGPGAGTMNER